jgi:hypothetical protein
MGKLDRDSLDPRVVNPAEPATAPPRADRLRALLFTGATLATTALTLGTLVDPKLPPFRGQ